MKNVSQITLPGELEVSILYEKGKLAYTFMHDGKSYGNAVTLENRSIENIINASLLLFTNAIETKKALQ